MSTNRWRKTSRKPKEAGQAILFVLLAMGLFLMGAVAFSVDMGNLWFHRQAAQTAADAACTAGAMDLLVDNTNHVTNQGGFTAGTAFDCNVNPTYAPCKYAALNGYNSNISPASTSAGNNVYVSFPAAVTGIPSTSPLFPPAALAPNPFMRVDVLDNAQTYFSGMLSGNQVQPVRAFAVCGTVLATSPVPIVVLNPTVSGALKVQGNPIIAILGGANRSIQVNSSSTSAVSIGGSGGIDLACGGTSFTGSNLGVFGGPTTQTPASGTCPGTPIPSTFPPNTSGFVPGVTGAYEVAAPVSDPFAQIPAPNPATLPAGSVTHNVPHNTHGCPDTAGCDEYTGGVYVGGINIKNVTAIFQPGIYHITDGLALDANSVVRPSTATPTNPINNIGGTVFYLTGKVQTCSGQSGLVCVGSNSGKAGLDLFNTSLAQCPGGTPPDPKLGLPATLSGNVLLAPCTGTYGDPLGKVRGILFFADRSSGTGGGWGGGGGFLLAGSMYFHQCNAAGTGTGCGSTPTDYNAVFQLQGASGSASYILGEIITDQLQLQGNPTINMALNPSATYSILKATLLR